MGPIDDILPALLAGAPDALLAIDASGAIVFISDQAERLFEWSRDDLIGQQVECLIPERLRGHHPALRASYAEHPFTRQMGVGQDLWGRRRDGSEFPAEINLSGFMTGRGAFTAVAVHDVTAHRRSEHHVRAVLESVPDAMVGVEASGRIVLVNDKAEALFGWTAQELIGQQIEVLVPEASFENHIRHRAKFVSEKVTRVTTSGVEVAGLHRDGTVFPVEISLSALHDRDQVLVLAAVRDITERVESEKVGRLEALEAQRERFDRLESLGQLAGGVAHDFNNLLGVILNYSTLLSRQLTDPLAIADVGQITAAAERAAALTRQLLAFARRDVAHREPLDVNELIESFVALMRRTLGEGIEVRLAVAVVPLVVLADRQQLEQVLLNLGINSRDAMPAGGVLTITTAVQLDQVVIAVSDTGLGMEPDVLVRALEPFFTTKPPGAGTGLGLASVFGIVTQNGGQIGIKSAPSAGTSVSITLPRIVGDATIRENAPAAEGGRERLLLVEDEEALRVVTERILSGHGYDVVTAANGVEALELFDRLGGAIDLVVTDVVMPLMRGDELGQRLLERQPTLRLLLMSGFAASDAVPPGRLLEKPVSEGDLLRAIREVLDAVPVLD